MDCMAGWLTRLARKAVPLMTRLRIATLISVLQSFALVQCAESALSARTPTRHESVSCSDCHSLVAENENLSLLVDDSDLRCTECHDLSEFPTRLATAFHASGRRDCSGCHLFHTPRRLRVGDSSFQHAIGNAVVARHCESCHGEGRRSDGLGAGHLGATDLFHGGKPDLASLSPSQGCLLCHSSEAEGFAMADDAPRIHPAASHIYGEPLQNSAGVGGYSIRVNLDSAIRLFDGRIECQTCHDITGGTRFLLVALDGEPVACLGCHRRVQTDDPTIALAPRQ